MNERITNNNQKETTFTLKADLNVSDCDATVPLLHARHPANIPSHTWKYDALPDGSVPKHQSLVASPEKENFQPMRPRCTHRVFHKRLENQIS